MWSRQQVLADFHLYTCPGDTETEDSFESAHLHVTRCFLSERKYLKHIGYEEEEYEELENDDSVECSTYLNEESLKGELTSDQQKLANRLSTIALGDFELSSDSDASESGKSQGVKSVALCASPVNERLKKYLDGSSSLNGISEESPDFPEEEKVVSTDWETLDHSAVMEAMGLPLSFGRVRPKKTKKSKLTEKVIRKKFSSLWEQHGELMVYKSFVSIYPDYVDYYDQITGSIPPCVEIEITDDSFYNTSDTHVQSSHEETVVKGDYQDDEFQTDSHFPGSNQEAVVKGDYQDIEEFKTENGLLVIQDGGGDAPSVSEVCCDKAQDENCEAKEETAASSSVYISDPGDSNKREEEATLQETVENDMEESSNICYTESYCYSKPRSSGNKEQTNISKESTFISEHCYSMNENSGCEQNSGEDPSHDYFDDSECYSHEELITLLRGTHEDLKNQIYWYVKEKVSAWYQEHPNQKFKISSLDEDLVAIAEPYIQQVDQWEEGEAFDIGDDDYSVSQDEDYADEEEEEELVDGSFSGEKINNSLEALGLSVLRDSEKRESRKRKIAHGSIMVRRKNLIRETKQTQIDFGRQAHNFENTESSPMPAPRHFLFDEEGAAVEIQAQPGLDREQFDAESLLKNTELHKVPSATEQPRASPYTRVPSPDSSQALFAVDGGASGGTLPSAQHKEMACGSLQMSSKNCSSKSIRIKKKKGGVIDAFHEQVFADEPALKKYWHQRYRLFTKFDKGIKLDRESWFSVTPESIAAHTAKRLRSRVAIDAFCGAGGNSIQFAQTCDKVIAVDIDRTRLDLARHNASIYGVEHKIEFVHGDFLKLASDLQGDVVFLSPPWGGPSYLSQKVYDIDNMAGFNAMSLVQVARQITENVAFYLPRNSDIAQIAALPGKDGHVELEQNILDNKLKMMTAYFGGLIKCGCK